MCFEVFEEILNLHDSRRLTRDLKMDVEDYFIIGLVFAIVAFLSNLMSYGYIFLPSAYLAIAFAVGGFVKAFVKVVKVIIRENGKKTN